MRKQAARRKPERSIRDQAAATAGAIDCDLHATVPAMSALLPYLDDYWRDHLVSRGTDRLNLALTSYPPNAPFSGRPDWRSEAGVGSIFEIGTAPCWIR